MTWFTGWNYRKSITISNTGSTLTDYQILTTIDTASLITALKMRSDCGDIRCTDTDGSVLLNHWIESGCNTISTKIWVKIPSVPTGTKTIYLYYGNPSSTYDNSLGGNNTFLFFDDFEDNSLDTTVRWNDVGGTNTESNGRLTVTPGTNLWRGGVQSKNNSFDNFILETSLKLPTNNNGAIMFRGSSDADWNTAYLIRRSGSGGVTDSQIFDRKPTAVSYIDLATTTINTTGTDFYRHKLVVNGNSIKLYINESLALDATDSTLASGNIGFSDYVPTGVLTAEFIFVRKYTSPEPISSIPGTEELPIGYLDISSNPTDADIYTDSTFRGRTPSLLSLIVGPYNLKVSKTGYADYTEPIIITPGFTLTRSVGLTSLSHIAATNVTLDHATPCIEGTCIVTANVTWTNSGSGSGDFVPNIKINGNIQTPIYPSQSLAAGASVTKSFSIIGLPIGTHTICPDPN